MTSELLYVTREVSWLPWAIQYFFLIGLSVGCMVLSLPDLALGRAGWAGTGRPALIGALTCGLAAPVALIADLHQPGRFLNFYLHAQASSWMSWGSFFIPLYLGGLLSYTAATLWFRRWIKAAVAPTLLGGALVMLYTGAEVMVVAARPLWHTLFIPVGFALTAFAGALGMVRLLGHLRPHAFVADARIAAMLRWTMAVAGIATPLWLGLALSGLSAPQATVLGSAGLWLVALSFIGWGTARSHPRLSSICALALAWKFRWTVFIGGQVLPKTAAGITDYQLPLGPDGWLGIVGTLGLCLFLLIALVTFLPKPAKEA